jgi:hypothetical protein
MSTDVSGSRVSAVAIATGYGLYDRGVGVRVPIGAKKIFSPRRADRFWGPPSLLSNGSGREAEENMELRVYMHSPMRQLYVKSEARMLPASLCVVKDTVQPLTRRVGCAVAAADRYGATTG